MTDSTMHETDGGGPVADLTTCPECGGPAEVQWRAVLESTAGPVEHARLGCLQRHWFLLPVAMLATHTDADHPAGVTHARRADG